MPQASYFTDAIARPVGFSAGGGGSMPVPSYIGDGNAADSGGYPGLTPNLSHEQIQDVANACQEAERTGRAVKLSRPFVYTGIDLPGLRNGDRITAMVPWTETSPAGVAVTACMSDAEAARRCEQTPDNPNCERLNRWPVWAYGALGLAVAAVAYYVVKS